MTNGEIATTLNRFRKQGDLHRYERRMNKLDYDQKLKLVENLLAGDDPDEAIRSARALYVHASCKCGVTAIGTIQDLRLAGWKFEFNEQSDDGCPNYPQCLPKQEEVEVTF